MPAYITIDPEDRRPVYQQIADGVKAVIARGELVEGMALPSVRQLAADLGVNLNTVATAYRELQNESLIAIKPGSGAIVSARPAARKTEQLRGSLRTALTELVLSGVPRTQIVRMVLAELRALGKGVKG